MGSTDQLKANVGQGATINAHLPQLSLRQTFSIWGGVHVSRLRGTVLHVKDVTEVAQEINKALPPDAQVACVHLSTLKPCLAQLRPGGKAHYMRALMEARQVLVMQGFTHIALTGPMLRTLNLKPRLRAVAQYRTHLLIALPVAVGAWLCYGAALLAAKVRGRDSTFTSGMARTRRATMSGFRCYVICAL